MPEPSSGGRSAGDPGRRGDLAIVLHSHMPYVEGFGTYPFGEEWLFEAFASSHLPVLEVARSLTMTVTPVLADQLEDPGVSERMMEFVGRHRLDAAAKDAAGAGGNDPRLRRAAEAQAAHYRGALEALSDGRPALAAFQDAGRADQAEPGSPGVELIASAATHAVLPKLATVEGRRLQIDAGMRSHRRRFGRSRGFWLPECAFAPGVDAQLAEAGIEYTCLDQSRLEPELDAFAPLRMPSGVTGFTIDWPAVELVWSPAGYPGSPPYLEYHRLSENGTRLWAISGEPYDPELAAPQIAADAEAFCASVGERLDHHRSERGDAGLCVFAIDTELLGHWWFEGPAWLGAVIERAPQHGIDLVTLSESLTRHTPADRPARTSSWGEGKSLETWDSPMVADLARAARRLELRLIRALTGGAAAGPAAERAARELLAVQSSDWAFMDHRGQAGDYAYRRAVTHAAALLEALEGGGAGDSGDAPMRALAPDLSLSPLLAP